MNLPYYPRWLNKWYATNFGYFWLPCPLCGKDFGGHEAAKEGWSVDMWRGKGICRPCYKSRKQEIDERTAFFRAQLIQHAVDQYKQRTKSTPEAS